MPGVLKDLRRLLHWTLLATLLVAAMLVLFLPLIAIWMSPQTWEFEGTGLRYWLFVKGSRLERLGFIAPSDASPHYTVQTPEGTFPGSSHVSYASRAMPPEIIAHYEARCRAMGFAVTTQKTRADGPETLELTCEIEPYLDVEVAASRRQGDHLSKVAVKVLGSE